jgi:hypothetical protein
MTANTTEQLERTIMSYQKQVRELSEQLEAVKEERDILASWKRQALAVEAWWLEVDSFVRKMPQCGIGKDVAKECLRILKESVEVREALDEFFDIHQSCGIDEVPHGYRHAVDRVKAILNSK